MFVNSHFKNGGVNLRICSIHIYVNLTVSNLWHFILQFPPLQFPSSSLERIKHTIAKPVLSGHSKIDKTKVSKTNGSLMKVKSIAECSLGAFCNTFDLH